MKRLGTCTFLLLVLLSVTITGEDTIVVASWNLQDLGPRKDVAELAQVIQHFDVVALQEVETQEDADRLLAEIRRISASDRWEMRISDETGTGRTAEYYAFIYRADRVSYVGCSEGLYPEPTPDDFSREPFFATFRAGKFDFTLITVHITWGRLESLRTEECRRLVEVWRFVQDLDLDENDLILLGDFNRDKPWHSAFDELVDFGLTALLTIPGTRTTFGTTPSGGHWYDHLWIDLAFTTSEWTGRAGTGTPNDDSSGSGCSPEFEDVSDHCPIWAVFWTTSDDDPQEQ